MRVLEVFLEVIFLNVEVYLILVLVVMFDDIGILVLVKDLIYNDVLWLIKSVFGMIGMCWFVYLDIDNELVEWLGVKFLCYFFLVD